MKRLLARATETMQHFIEVDIGDDLAKELITAYHYGTMEDIIRLIKPIADKHGKADVNMTVDFVGFE